MSLHARLALWLGLSLALLFLLHGLVTERAPRITTEDYIATRLEHDAEWLAGSLHATEDGRVELDRAWIPPIYQRPGSGHYYLLRLGERLLLSASSEGRALPLPPSEGLHHERLPDGTPLLLLRHDLPDGDILLIAEGLGELNAHLSIFRGRFILISLALFALLLAAQFLLLRWALRPLRELREATERLGRGEIERLPEPHLRELRPLVAGFNGLLAQQAERLRRARHGLADLAHALKTPLSVLLASPSAQADPITRQALERIEGITQRELRRARWGSEEARQAVGIDAAAALDDLLMAMRRIHAARAIAFEAHAPASLPVRMEREDLLELLGNLLDNAAKWARSRVRVTLSGGAGEGLVAVIEDDGPGAEVERLNHAHRRGQRLDEQTPGHGLGLTIGREIVAAYGGQLHFERATGLGGLKVSVELPPRVE
ncbi:MAG: sensor histidine kinase [Halothiobacillaceae bacterium]|nr:MAG: sensor histidine kinase [Halothiobacillaceae bacterium]